MHHPLDALWPLWAAALLATAPYALALAWIAWYAIRDRLEP